MYARHMKCNATSCIPLLYTTPDNSLHTFVHFLLGIIYKIIYLDDHIYMIISYHDIILLKLDAQYYFPALLHVCKKLFFC